jgi:PTH1 family peptidyl-tRNA hydrolase
MILIVGLGNPGKKYEKTRHNVGWRVLNYFKEKNNFQPWKEKKKVKAMISKGEIGKEKIQLIKPLTFMNLSGESLKSILNYYKAKPEKIIIVHDDIDINFNKIKISQNRGTAGHKGVLSIIEKLKTKNFIRIRIGIKPKEKKLSNTEKFVISNFNKKEEKELTEVIKKTTKAIELIIKEGTKKSMTIFNKKSGVK